MTYNSEELIKMNFEYGAKNYKPLEVVISKGEGIYVWDVEGNKYIDMLSAYSAINHGHRHPEIIKAVKEQLDTLTLTSRAFHNDKLPLFLKKLCEITNMEMALPMNTGAEAVETALKTVRKWAYKKGKIKENEGEIIVAENNFHGRTITIVSFSTEYQYKEGFGPFTPGFKIVPYNDIEAIKNAFTDKTIGVLLEPIQGEGGIIVPDDGYIKEVKKICEEHGALLMLDEIQTGFGRTGKMFAWEYDGEEAKPDIIILGKALGGGIMPVSAIASSKDVLSVFNPGDHGSTFGGNPLASVVGIKSIEILQRDKLEEKAFENGKYFMDKLKTLKSQYIKEIRGKGLLIGLELTKPAKEFVIKLKDKGLLCKETHERVIRFAPPLIINKDEIDQAFNVIKEVFEN